MSRCRKADTKGAGCVREAGHTGRHKVRDDPHAVYAACGLVDLDRPGPRGPLWPPPRPETEWSGGARRTP